MQVTGKMSFTDQRRFHERKRRLNLLKLLEPWKYVETRSNRKLKILKQTLDERRLNSNNQNIPLT